MSYHITNKTITGIPNLFEKEADIQKQKINTTSFSSLSDFEGLRHRSENLRYFLNFLEMHYRDRKLLRSFKSSLIENSRIMSSVSSLIHEKEARDQRKSDERAFMKAFESLASTVAVSTDTLTVDEMPLQSAFASILLNKYMPRQDKDLRELAQEFYYANIGQDFTINILEKLMDFNSSPVYYDLRGYLPQTENMNVYNDGYGEAVKRISQEKNSARRDLNTITELYQMIDDVLAAIPSYTDWSEEQRNDLRDQFTAYKTHLQVSERQLNDLYRLLKVFSLNPLDDNSQGAFEIINGDVIMGMLRDLEGYVVDGQINSKTGDIQGGLLPFFNLCNSNVQSFGDLAQTQQMAIQLELAAIQQEWNIVSTSLNILSRIYRGLITDIKGR